MGPYPRGTRTLPYKARVNHRNPVTLGLCGTRGAESGVGLVARQASEPRPAPRAFGSQRSVDVARFGQEPQSDRDPTRQLFAASPTLPCIVLVLEENRDAEQFPLR